MFDWLHKKSNDGMLLLVCLFVCLFICLLVILLKNLVCQF